ncbi:MAG: CocE/NonD family hydrolase, partial [Anaerolineae bacterium]|nr:CocE/NonD family hydrolase [Anaerolineae bacterium]
HLATIIPMYFTDDRYTDDCHYRGGAWRCYYDIGAYGASMIGMNAMPPYPEYSGEDWAAVWEQHLAHNTPYLLQWLAHPTDGEYWQSGSIRGRYDALQCSVFMIGGWRDGYPNPPLRTFAHLTVPKKVLIGPWNHARPANAIPGPCIDYLPEVVRWCDTWLKGEDNGVMDEPPVCVYMQGYDDPRADRLTTTGYWRTETAWPLAGAREATLYPTPDGRLDAAEPAKTAQHGYAYCPTVGTSGGLWSGGVPYGLPTDQRPDEVLSLNYTSAPLDAPLEILGQPLAVLHVQSSAPVMAFVARLCDVAPDGTSALVCNGVLNATRRASLTHPQPLDPDEVYELQVELDCTAWRFEPDHRIRLSVCSADFPNLWPTPYPGYNHLHLGPGLSHVVLPLVPVKPAVNECEFAPSPVPVDLYRHRPDLPAWEIVHDRLGDRVGLRQRRHSVARNGPQHEAVSETELEVWASNRHPANVSAVGKHLRRILRPDGTMTIDTAASLRSTETAFHLTVDLVITVNAMPHHSQRWVQSFPRVLL